MKSEKALHHQIPITYIKVRTGDEYVLKGEIVTVDRPDGTLPTSFRFCLTNPPRQESVWKGEENLEGNGQNQ